MLQADAETLGGEHCPDGELEHAACVFGPCYVWGMLGVCVDCVGAMRGGGDRGRGVLTLGNLVFYDGHFLFDFFEGGAIFVEQDLDTCM